MILGRVTGSIVSTIKHHGFREQKLLTVQPVNLEGRPKGGSLIALDRADAGKGDLVLVNHEGGCVKIMFGEMKPVQAVIVGVVDKIDVEWQHDR